MTVIKGLSFQHKVGNMIGGLARIIEGLILFFSLGNVNITLTLNWNMYRRGTGKFL